MSMVTRGQTYKQIKKGYLKMFAKIDKYLKEHPDAKLEYDELNEPDPTLGFVHKDGNVRISTTFEFKRSKDQ